MRSFLSITLISLSFLSHSQEKYQVTIDLTQANEDKVPVEIVVPVIESETVEYHMAKIVPGTYSISDFGRFVSDFKALDAQGNELTVNKTTTNKWEISNAKKLSKITYWIEDSYDDFAGYGKNKLFEPGGMSIEADKDVFVINTFGFIGYIDGLKFQPYDLTIKHSKKTFGATSLMKTSTSDTLDTFSASNFNFLADAPIMYCEPDTISKTIAGAEILISVYSPNKMLKAADVMDNIDELMEAQAKYLGGKLPVDRYAYLIYLFDKRNISGAMGALEHSYSSLYTLPEMNPQRISQTVKDVAAHEFFHIVTPLNIHSEEIGDFNYIDPKMSKHLWLYEGVTEYASHHVQIKYGLYGIDKFLDEMQNKMSQQKEYNVDIPYTEFSQNILEPRNERRYGDVYAGGALIAMCLDLTIIKSTNGEKDLQILLRELAKQYGPNKSFKDDELFSEIEKITNSDVRIFLDKYVGGTDSLPYKEILSWAGINYMSKDDNMIITAGKFSPGLNDQDEIYVRSADNLNSFGKSLGFKEGDVLLKWNNAEVTADTFGGILQDFYANTEKGDKVTLLVRREVKGKTKEVKLKAKAQLVKSSQNLGMELEESPTDEQKFIRKTWLGIE
jgi:predicted metalloprotease with PDZ domain